MVHFHNNQIFDRTEDVPDEEVTYTTKGSGLSLIGPSYYPHRLWITLLESCWN